MKALYINLIGLACLAWHEKKSLENQPLFLFSKKKKKKPLFLGCASFSVPAPAVDEARKLANTVTRMYLNY